MMSKKERPENFLTLLHTFRDYKEGKINNIY